MACILRHNPNVCSQRPTYTHKAVHFHWCYLGSVHSVFPLFILPLSDSLTLLCVIVKVCVKCMGLLILSSCVEGIVGG